MPLAGDDILASDVNLELDVDELTADSGTWTTTESGALLTVTATVVSGRRYELKFGMAVSTTTPVGGVVGPPTNETSALRVREDSALGAEVSRPTFYLPNSSTIGYWCEHSTDWVASATGAKTFVVTGQRTTGAGTASHQIRAGATRKAKFKIELINP